MGWHEVAGADTLGEDEAMAVVLGERPIALCRSGGRFYALHNVCTHQFALLSDGYVEEGCIECPLHQGRFDLQTGTPKALPVARIHGNGAVKSVELADGAELPADLVVIGVGIIPNTELAENAGAASDDGVVVDEYCRTTLENVYAAGDCTNHFNPILERRVRLESWQNAQNQAIAAARNIAGLAQRYAEVPWFWSDQLDANIQMVGVAEPAMQVVWRGERLAFGLVADRLRLAVGFNMGGEIRSARRLIEARAPLSPSRLADGAVRLKDLLTEATCSASTP